MLRYSAACGIMLQAVGGGNLIFQKASKLANRYIKHKTMHLLTPCKDGHNIIISWSNCYSSLSHFRFLSILLTYMIAKWRNVSLLILRRSCVRMCPNKLKALSTWHADRGWRTKNTAIDDKIGKSGAFTSHQATLAEVVSGSGDGSSWVVLSPRQWVQQQTSEDKVKKTRACQSTTPQERKKNGKNPPAWNPAVPASRTSC